MVSKQNSAATPPRLAFSTRPPPSPLPIPGFHLRTLELQLSAPALSRGLQTRMPTRVSTRWSGALASFHLQLSAELQLPTSPGLQLLSYSSQSKPGMPNPSARAPAPSYHESHWPALHSLGLHRVHAEPQPPAPRLQPLDQGTPASTRQALSRSQSLVYTTALARRPQPGRGRLADERRFQGSAKEADQ